MSVLVNKDSRVIIQGFTGSEGSFHADQMIEYGTRVVGGVTPGKGGESHLGLPVFNTMSEAVEATNANVSIIFVPPAFAADSILEAIDAKVELIICITEGIPIEDMVLVNVALKKSSSRLIGPNCPGVITPGEAKIGIMPGFVFKADGIMHKKIGIVSKSGTLTYEAADQLVKAGFGISTAVGIGGDPIIGSSTKDIVQLFMEDKDTDAIVLIGEIGGSMEADAALWLKDHLNKPVVGFIAGQTAPLGRRMGHAGAIVGGKDDTAAAKMKILSDCGIHVVASPADIGHTMAQVYASVNI